MKEKKFDGMMKELEGIVRMLESGETPLEAALEQYRRGTGLIREMTMRLEHAKSEILTLRQEPKGEGQND